MIRILMAAILWITPALAADEPALPSELIFHGKPVEPYCLTRFTGDSSRYNPVSLLDCLSEKIVLGKSPAWEGDRYGYEYGYGNGSAALGQSYVYYRYLGRMEDQPVVWVEESSGGSGKFSAVFSLKRQENTLRLGREYGGGDRCNGGVTEARMEKENLIIHTRITPFDFLTLAGENPRGLQSGVALEDSAASCYGIAEERNGKLEGVQLTCDPAISQDREEWTRRFTYQACFNRLYRTFCTAGSPRLAAGALKAFARQFDRECVVGPHKDPGRSAQ